MFSLQYNDILMWHVTLHRANFFQFLRRLISSMKNRQSNRLSADRIISNWCYSNSTWENCCTACFPLKDTFVKPRPPRGLAGETSGGSTGLTGEAASSRSSAFILPHHQQRQQKHTSVPSRTAAVFSTTFHRHTVGLQKDQEVVSGSISVRGFCCNYATYIIPALLL